MKQRTSAVTRSPQQRSYVTQIRLARWHYSRSEPRSLGRMDQQQSCWTVGRARTCARYAQRSLGQNPRDRAQRPHQAFGKLNSAVWGGIFQAFPPQRSPIMSMGPRHHRGFASPSEDPRLAEFSFLFVATRTQCNTFLLTGIADGGVMAGGSHGGHAEDCAHKGATAPDAVLAPTGRCPYSGNHADLRGHSASVETAQLRRPIVVTCPPTRCCSTQF